MLVEDTSAFIEQLNVTQPDKRAAKQRQRVLRAELDVLRIEWEMRVETNAIVDMEGALAILGDGREEESGSASGDRRLKGARMLEKRIEGARGRMETLRREHADRRERLRRVEAKAEAADRERKASAQLVRLHSSGHHVECSEDRFRRLAHTQLREPVLVVTEGKRRWWWFRDRFWWGDAHLTAPEVERLILATDMQAYHRTSALQTSRDAILANGDGIRESIPQATRFAVWFRDEGRCVRCGSEEGVDYYRIVPLEDGGSSEESNLELRCQACART